MYGFNATLVPVGAKNKGLKFNRSPEYPVADYPDPLSMLFPRYLRSWLTPFAEEFATPPVWDFYVTEADKEIFIRAELPGFEENEFDVNLVDNLLTIKAEKKEEANGNYRSYRRTVLVPVGIDPNKIKATYHNGILELHLPKPEEVKGKHITVKVN